MKVTRTQFIVAGVGLVVISTAVAIIIKKSNNRKLIADITTKINNGTAQFGDYNDIPTMDAFNPQFWRRPEFLKTTVYDFNKAINLAKTLHGYIFNNDDELTYTLISGIATHTMLSEITEAYKTTYGANLGLDLVQELSATWLKKIYTYVKYIPINL